MFKVQRVQWLALIVALGASGLVQAEDTPFVVKITQVPCQFKEIEGRDRAYAVNDAAHCRNINRRSAELRMAMVEELVLEAGPTIFRVTNQRVSHPVGFYLRPIRHSDLDRLPQFSVGSLEKGETRDFRVNLKPGEYLISCPLNATLDYPVLVVPRNMLHSAEAVKERFRVEKKGQTNDR